MVDFMQRKGLKSAASIDLCPRCDDTAPLTFRMTQRPPMLPKPGEKRSEPQRVRVLVFRDCTVSQEHALVASPNLNGGTPTVRLERITKFSLLSRQAFGHEFTSFSSLHVTKSGSKMLKQEWG